MHRVGVGFALTFCSFPLHILQAVLHYVNGPIVSWDLWFAQTSSGIAQVIQVEAGTY